ncbi:MAG: DUF58 domain-containing protein [Planctomycetes bacterium]|nr:DUF58 domain-containing protein [Planctomycetota bacterium]
MSSATSRPVSSEFLFEEDFLRKLEYLVVVARKIFAGRIRAQRRTKRFGSGVQFADYRSYVQGDDFRYVDWNAYVRFEHLFLKLFEEEEDLHIYLLLDASRSMDFGQPRKFDYARRLAAAIGYIGLASLDRINVTPFAESLGRQLSTMRGKGQVFNLLRFLSRLEVMTQTDFGQALAKFAHQRHHHGLAVVISDFFDPAGYVRGLNCLRFNGFEVFAIQVLAHAESNPTELGDLRLLDVETSLGRNVTVNERLLRTYRARFSGFCDELKQFCLEREIGYVRATTSIPFDDLVLKMLRSGRFLQ